MKMNMSIFDNLTIKIKYRNFDENPLAIATINLNREAEIRFAAILWKKDRSGIFFTMPSLKEFHYQTCFVILDKNLFSEIKTRIIHEFLNGSKDQYRPNEIELINKALNSNTEEIDIDSIPI